MKDNVARTLLVVSALLLLNGYDTSAFASPFGDNPITVTVSSGLKTLKETADDVKDVVVKKVDKAKEVVAEGSKAVKKKATDTAKSAKKSISSSYGSVTKKINSFFNKKEDKPYIKSAIFLPGHESKEIVCQGIAYLDVEDSNSKNTRYTLLSYYPKTSKQPSQLLVMNGKKAIRRFALYKSEGKAYTGHAGGIAVAGKYVWVASGNKIFGFKTKDIIDFINDDSAKAKAVKGLPSSFDAVPGKDIVCAKSYGVDSKASYISFDGTYIWVGDFVKTSSKGYSPIKHHKAFKRNCWIAGYKVDSKGMPTSSVEYTYKAGDSSYKVHKPDAVIAMRESVQGMAVCDDYVALTTSFGALNSKLSLYKNPLNKKSEKYSYKPAGQSKTFTVDAWELENKKNWVNTVTLPAGAEDLEYDGDSLYVTFECSSKNYKQKWTNINPAIKLTDNYYLIDVKKAVKYDD